MLNNELSNIDSLVVSKDSKLIWLDKGEKIEEIYDKRLYKVKEREDLSIKLNHKNTNILFEGDNYIGLQELKKKKIGVDVVYIDPPYNTGNDFVFNDSFKEEKSWLSFMKRRLFLAREVMNDDGIIFISIDDNEQAYLRILLDNIFGKENFIETFLWNHNNSGSATSKYSRKTLEYIHCYAKDKSKVNFRFKHKIKTSNTTASLYNSSNKINELIFPKGSINFKVKKNRTIKKFAGKDLWLNNDIVVRNGVNANEVSITSRWKWSQEYLNKQLALGNMIYSATDKLRLSYKKFNNKRIEAPKKLLTNVGYSITGSYEIQKYNLDFDYPKPVSLIEYLIKMVTYKNKESIILDFFAGSGTTGEAVLRLNEKDNGNRKFILITNNELSDTKKAKILNKKYNAGIEMTQDDTILKSKSNLKKYSNFLKKEDFIKYKKTEEYKKLGLCRSVTLKRMEAVIEGYTNNKGEKVEGLNSCNLKYFETTIFNRDKEIEDKEKIIA